MTAPALSPESLDAAVAALPDNGLAAARREALANLRRDGLPGIREENWKYTDLSPVIDIANGWLDGGACYPAHVDASPPAGISAHWIRIINGQPDAGSLAALPKGVSVNRLSDTSADLAPAGRLGDLNIALLHDGLNVSVDKGVSLEQPIGIYVHDVADSASSALQVRVNIDLASESQASFVEYQSSAGSMQQFSNSVVTLKLGQGARCDYVRIQARAPHHDQTSYLGIALGRDAQFRNASFDLGGRVVRNDLDLDITSPGAEAQFGGLYLVGDGQHIDNHTRVDHRVGPAISRQEYRGVLAGKARGVWNGKAIVHEGADGTDAEQANHNLLLSEKAEINAKPELEIYADDVKCSHGTTVGQLDESALYYLRTRGLEKTHARQMLTRAFAQAVVDRMPIAELRDYLAGHIAERLVELTQEVTA